MKMLILTAALGLIAVSPAAAAPPTEDAFVVKIPVRDLNLSTPAGLRALRGRAAHAADVTCGDSRQLRDIPAEKRCLSEFMRNVNSSIALLQAQQSRAMASR